jgi:hypothetical protein
MSVTLVGLGQGIFRIAYLPVAMIKFQLAVLLIGPENYGQPSEGE